MHYKFSEKYCGCRPNNTVFEQRNHGRPEKHWGVYLLSRSRFTRPESNVFPSEPKREPFKSLVCRAAPGS